MDANRVTLLDDIEARLNRLACDVIAEPGSADEAIGGLLLALEEGNLGDVAALVREAVAAAPAVTEVAPALEAIWQQWRADDEIAPDVAALQCDPELAGMFAAEALDHLGTIEATLLKLEETPGDKTLLNDVFRPFHTIKGNAGALGVTTVQHFAHKVESLLDRCRSGQHAVGSAEIDLVLAAVDLLTAMINDVTARAAGKRGRSLRAERANLIDVIERLLAGGGTPSVARGADATPAATIDLSDVKEPQGARETGDLAGKEPGAAKAVQDAKETREPREAKDVREIREVKDTREARDGREARADQTAVKVDTRKLDGLVDAVGELVILQSLIYEDAALTKIGGERLTRNLAQLRRITTELQRSAMSMRMVPIRQTFQKMSRLVRDLSRQAGKPIELSLSGEETELDRKVVEDINDPLMHMVRNSVDHGIEPPELRRAAGKVETGHLSLRAFHQGGNIVIEVSDDGAGLNAEKILAKAVAQGLVPAGADLPPAAIYELLFRPGFSTADKVTEISGRGVGMDVVKRNVEALRGRIETRTERGAGTTFSIKLPLTLAILDGLLTRVGHERFVIPTFAVRESLRPSSDQVHSVSGEPRMIRVRDRLLPLVWLSRLFNVESTVADATSATVVVIEDERQAIGLVVDELVGKQEVVVKSLGDAFATVRGVAGGAILGDGRIGLILDAHGIVRLMNSNGGALRADAA